MKNAKRLTLSLILLCSCFLLSVDYPLPKLNCNHSSKLKETYYIKKKESAVIKAIRHHGFEIKRSLEDTYGNSKNIHHWRIININTPNGLIKELAFKIEHTAQQNTNLTILKVCFTENFSDDNIDEKLKEHRKYIKRYIINKIRRFRD